jgi:dihydrofolate reductase
MVLYGAACSLDGFIAGQDDEVDWLHWSSEVAEISNQVLGATDVVLMGRRTYEVALRAGTSAYPNVHNYVFSQSYTSERNIPNLTVVREDAGEFVRELKQRDGRNICVLGGGELARSLFQEGLIDEVGLNVHPVLLGGGIPMFPAGGYRHSLALTEARPLQGGCFYLRYRVNK